MNGKFKNSNALNAARKDLAKEYKENAEKLNQQINVNSDALGCFNCGRATYIGDGGYMCDKHDKIVIDDWEATDDFMCCDGNDYKGDD